MWRALRSVEHSLIDFCCSILINVIAAVRALRCRAARSHHRLCASKLAGASGTLWFRHLLQCLFRLSKLWEVLALDPLPQEVALLSSHRSSTMSAKVRRERLYDLVGKAVPIQVVLAQPNQEHAVTTVFPQVFLVLLRELCI